MHKESMIKNFEPTLTQHAFLPQTLVENMMKQCAVTGMTYVNQAQQILEDVSSAPESFLDMQNVLTRASESFASLPQNIASRFKSPMELLSFLDKEENRAEAEKLGLVAPAQVKQNAVISNGEPAVDNNSVPE